MEEELKKEQARLKRRATMLEKYGGEEGLKEHYREMKRKSMAHPNNAKGTAKSGYSYMTTEQLQELSRQGNKIRWSNRNHEKGQTATKDRA